MMTFFYVNRMMSPTIALIVAVIALAGVIVIPGSVGAKYQVRKPGQVQPTLTVTGPAKDAVWEKGQRYQIKWNSTGVCRSVKITLQDNDGRSVTVVASTLNTGSYTWAVPATLTEKSYRLVITSADSKTKGESTGRITIQPRSVSAVQSQAQSQAGTIVTQAKTQTPSVTTNQPSIGYQVHRQTAVGNLQQAEAGQITGFVSPDFEIEDLQYQQGRLHLWVRNNGTPHEGTLSFRLQATEPADGFNPFHFDNVMSLNVSIGPGQTAELQLGQFLWPTPVIDHHWLIFALELDPSNEIVEGNELNNHFQTSICRPCNMEISGLSHESFTVNDDLGVFRVFGHFGSIKGTKVLRFVNNLSTYNVPIAQWSDASLEPSVNVARFGHGTYQVTAYCRHPAITEPYPSNSVTLRINRQSTGHGESPIDARKVANALAEEFIECLDISSFSSKIESLSTRTLVGYRVEVQCHVDPGQSGIRDVVMVTHELWRDGYRVAYWEDPAFEWNLNDQYLAHTFEDLTAGSYEYRARILCSGGQEDSQSINFEL